MQKPSGRSKSSKLKEQQGGHGGWNRDKEERGVRGKVREEVGARSGKTFWDTTKTLTLTEMESRNSTLSRVNDQTYVLKSLYLRKVTCTSKVNGKGMIA